MSDVVSGHIIKKRDLSATCKVLSVVVEFLPGESQRYAEGRHLAMVAMQESSPSRYGDKSRILFQSGFFQNPHVLKAIGTDDQYNKWVRSLPSAISKRVGTPGDPIEAAHIRMVAEGAGTGIKNQYGTIPLLKSEHRLQTDKGYDAIGGKEKLTRLLCRYRLDWAKEVVKYRLGTFESFAQIPPAYFIHFCRANGIEKFLPKEYRAAANETN